MHKTTRIVATACVLAMAGPAALADGDRLYFEISNDLSPSQPSAVVTLWAGFDARDHALASVRTDVGATEGNWFALALLDPMRGPGSSPGRPADGGRTVEGVFAWQLHWPTDILADPSNPVALWRAEIEVFDFTPRTLDLGTLTTQFDVYVSRDSSRTRSALPELEEASGVIRVVPAPGAAVLLGMGLAMANAHRRR